MSDPRNIITDPENEFVSTMIKTEFNNVLDLSKRRRDSVETLKTVSPYDSSSFGDKTPPLQDYIPLRMNSVVHRSRALTPNFYELSTPSRCCYSPQDQHALHPPQMQHGTPSPNGIFTKRSPNSSSGSLFMYKAAVEAQIFPNQHIQTRQSDDLSENVSHLQQNIHDYPMLVGRDGKLSRPFKAYRNTPISSASSILANDPVLDPDESERFNHFRKVMLERIHASNGGQATISNPKMRRTSTKNKDFENPSNTGEFASDCFSGNNSSDSSVKDKAYLERRKKNNAAAKKSRDRRRMKEDEIAIRATYLDRENIILKAELATTIQQLHKVTGRRLPKDRPY